MEKDKKTALLLCIFLGYFGAHKFYEKKTGIGILYLFTFGIFGIGWIVDIILLIQKPEKYNVDNSKEFRKKISEEKYKGNTVQFKETNNEFNGIYKYSFGKKIEVKCPRCHSEDCSYFQQQKIIPGKTKTRYTANLNPLRPFTLVNKKEKVVREEEIITKNMIQCKKCGYIFK